MTRDIVKILGVNVDKVNTVQALDKFESFLNEPSCHLVFTPNPEMIYAASNDPLLLEVLNSADLAIPDGMSVVKAAGYLGEHFEERVTGVDFSYAAMEKLAEKNKNLSVFFLGAKPGIAALAAEKLSEKIPHLVVAGVHDGYFSADQEEDMVREINDSGAVFLLAALGSPKQEFFLKKYQDKLNVRAAIGVGGSFDVWSETVKRAPMFWQRHNLEWLYRLITEPSRFKRMLNIPKFIIKVKRSAR